MLSIFKRKSIEDVKEAFQTQLNNKYNEEFIISNVKKIKMDGYGKGYRCDTYPAIDPTISFEAYLTRNLDHLMDTYTLSAFQDDFRKEILRIANQYFHNEFWLDTAVNSSGFNADIYKRTFTSFKEFMKAGRNDLAVSIKIILKSDQVRNYSSEAATIKKFLEEVISFGLIDGELLIHYTQALDFNELLREYKQYIHNTVEFFQNERQNLGNENLYQLVLEPDKLDSSFHGTKYTYTFTGIDFKIDNIPSQNEIEKYLKEEPE